MMKATAKNVLIATLLVVRMTTPLHSLLVSSLSLSDKKLATGAVRFQFPSRQVPANQQYSEPNTRLPLRHGGGLMFERRFQRAMVTGGNSDIGAIIVTALVTATAKVRTP